MYFVLEYLKFSKKVNVMGSKLYFYRDREGSTVHGFQIDKYRSKYQIMKKIKILIIEILQNELIFRLKSFIIEL